MYAIFTSSTNGLLPAICYVIELVVGRPNQPSAEGDLPIQYVVAGTRFPPCLSRSSSLAVSIKGCPADVPELPFQRLQTSVCIRSPYLNPCWNMCVQENIQGLLPTEFRSSHQTTTFGKRLSRTMSGGTARRAIKLCLVTKNRCFVGKTPTPVNAAK